MGSDKRKERKNWKEEDDGENTGEERASLAHLCAQEMRVLRDRPRWRW